MSEQSNDDQKLLAELFRAKVLFQQRSILAYLGEMPPGSNDDQETSAYRQQREGGE